MTDQVAARPIVNEAAERLHNAFTSNGWPGGKPMLAEALATERHNTVERIRARRSEWYDRAGFNDSGLARVLDEVAS